MRLQAHLLLHHPAHHHLPRLARRATIAGTRRAAPDSGPPQCPPCSVSPCLWPGLSHSYSGASAGARGCLSSPLPDAGGGRSATDVVHALRTLSPLLSLCGCSPHTYPRLLFQRLRSSLTNLVDAALPSPLRPLPPFLASRHDAHTWTCVLRAHPSRLRRRRSIARCIWILFIRPESSRSTPDATLLPPRGCACRRLAIIKHPPSSGAAGHTPAGSSSPSLSPPPTT